MWWTRGRDAQGMVLSCTTRACHGGAMDVRCLLPTAWLLGFLRRRRTAAGGKTARLFPGCSDLPVGPLGNTILGSTLQFKPGMRQHLRLIPRRLPGVSRVQVANAASPSVAAGSAHYLTTPGIPDRAPFRRRRRPAGNPPAARTTWASRARRSCGLPCCAGLPTAFGLLPTFGTAFLRLRASRRTRCCNSGPALPVCYFR